MNKVIPVQLAAKQYLLVDAEHWLNAPVTTGRRFLNQEETPSATDVEVIPSRLIDPDSNSWSSVRKAQMRWADALQVISDHFWISYGVVPTSYIEPLKRSTIFELVQSVKEFSHRKGQELIDSGKPDPLLMFHFSLKRALPLPGSCKVRESLAVLFTPAVDMFPQDTVRAAVEAAMKFKNIALRPPRTKILNSNAAVIGWPRSIGGRNRAVKDFLPYSPLPLSGRVLPEETPESQLKVLHNVMINDTRAAVNIARQIRRQVKLPVLQYANIPEPGYKQRIPALPEWYTSILAQNLGTIGFKVVSRLCGRTFRQMNPELKVGNYALSTDFKSSSDSIPHEFALIAWESMLKHTNLSIEEAKELLEDARYLLGAHEIIIPQEYQKPDNPFLGYPSSVEDLVEVKEPSIDSSFALHCHSGLSKYLLNFGNSYMMSHKNWNPVITAHPEGEHWKLTQNPKTTIRQRITLQQWIDRRIAWQSEYSNKLVQPSVTKRGIHMCYGVSFPALTLLNVGVFHHFTDRITDYVVTGDDASSTFDDEKTCDMVRNAQRRTGFIPNTQKEYFSTNGYVHAEHIYLKDQVKYRRVPEFKMKSILGLGKGREAGYQWCTVPRTTYENSSGLPEAVRRRVFEYLYAKYHREYDLLYKAGVDIFAIPAKPVFPYRLLPCKPNKLSESVRAGRINDINTIFTPRPQQPWAPMSSLKLISACLDKGRDIRAPRYCWINIGETPEGTTFHWTRFPTIKAVEARLSYLTHNCYREAGETITPKFTGSHALMRYLSLASNSSHHVDLTTLPAGEKDPVYTTIESYLNDDPMPQQFIPEPRGNIIFVDLQSYMWNFKYANDFIAIKPLLEAILASRVNQEIPDTDIIFVRERGKIEYATRYEGHNVYIWNRNDTGEHETYIQYAKWARKHGYRPILLTYDKRLRKAVEGLGYNVQYFSCIDVEEFVPAEIGYKRVPKRMTVQQPVINQPAPVAPKPLLQDIRQLNMPPRVSQDVRNLVPESKNVPVQSNGQTATKDAWTYMSGKEGNIRYPTKNQHMIDAIRADAPKQVKPNIQKTVGLEGMVKGTWVQGKEVETKIARIICGGQIGPAPTK